MGKKVTIIILVFFLLIIAGGIFYYNTVVNNPFTSNEENILITIEKDETLYNLLETLENEGKIKKFPIWFQSRFSALSATEGTGIFP